MSGQAGTAADPVELPGEGGDADGEGADVAASNEPEEEEVAAPRSQVTQATAAPVKKKSGLDVTPVSKDHWSSNLKKPAVTGSHVMVTVIDAKGLLASNTYDGKSDPLCFLWLGPPAAYMEGNDGSDAFMDTTDDEECMARGILRTSMKPGTLEPVWNENIFFPLALEEVNSLNKLRLLIYCRDEDEDVDEQTGEVVRLCPTVGAPPVHVSMCAGVLTRPLCSPPPLLSLPGRRARTRTWACTR